MATITLHTLTNGQSYALEQDAERIVGVCGPLTARSPPAS